MSEARFQCPSCQRSYRWKPEMAGRTAKCKCGQAISVPTEAPDGAEELFEAMEVAAPQSDLDRMAAAASSSFTPPPALPTGSLAGYARRLSGGRALAMDRANRASDVFGCQMAAVSLGLLVLAMIIGVAMQYSRQSGTAMPILLEVLRVACFGLAVSIAAGRILFILAAFLELIAFILLLVLINGGVRPSPAIVYMAFCLPSAASCLYFIGLLVKGSRLGNMVIVICSGICALLAAAVLVITFSALGGRGSSRGLGDFLSIAGFVLIAMVLTLLGTFIYSAVTLKNSTAASHGEPTW